MRSACSIRGGKRRRVVAIYQGTLRGLTCRANFGEIHGEGLEISNAGGHI